MHWDFYLEHCPDSRDHTEREFQWTWSNLQKLVRFAHFLCELLWSKQVSGWWGWNSDWGAGWVPGTLKTVPSGSGVLGLQNWGETRKQLDGKSDLHSEECWPKKLEMPILLEHSGPIGRSTWHHQSRGPSLFMVRSGHMGLWLWVSGPMGWGFWDGVRYWAALGSLGVDKAWVQEATSSMGENAAKSPSREVRKRRRGRE